MSQEIFTTHDLSVGIHYELLTQLNISLRVGDRVGIIGNNGSGKTTLLRTIAKIEEPLSGSLLVKGECFFVPQIHHTTDWQGATLKQYAQQLGIVPAKVVAFITNYFGLHLSENALMETLSGGQQSVVALACGFVAEPELLLLDEPTNHLDVNARTALIDIIRSFSGTIVCVSHDAWFLRAVTNKLWIIRDGGIRAFTGSYAEYQEEVARDQESRLRQLEVVFKNERKLQTAKRRESARATRSESVGKAHRTDRSTGRGAQGYFQERAERVKGKKKEIFDRKSEQLETQKKSLILAKRKKVSGSIISMKDKGVVVRITDATLFIHDKKLVEHIALTVTSGDRLAILGNNGTGKSALMKAILGRPGYVLEPPAKINPSFRIEYLDQHYSIVDLEKSILDNVVDFSGAQTDRVRQHLSHFLFHDSGEVLKKAKHLSGGMIARLAFVMLTIAPIDLLILDEPTNNLDMETIAEIQELLADYHGALMVISHDLDFLRGLRITKKYHIDQGQLKEKTEL